MIAAVQGLLGALAIAAILAATAEAGPLEDGIDAYHEKAYDKAVELWRPLAEAGNAPAQYLLGSLYVEGNGVEHDDATAFMWFQRAANQGDAAAQYNVGASYAWTGGPGFAHSAAAKAGVKNMTETLAVEWGPYGIQVNGLVPGLMPHEDMTADIQANLARTSEKDPLQPALRVGRPRELGWAATFLASPYARFISGHTLVVDGANWQRRTLTNPPVVTVRDQMGKGPFEPAS